MTAIPTFFVGFEAGRGFNRGRARGHARRAGFPHYPQACIFESRAWPGMFDFEENLTVYYLVDYG